jgi:anion-transporting  ArsA/GET3 family ATPase
VAAALALALAAGGRRVLLVEVEARQAIAQLFDLPPLPPTETRIATAEGNGEVYGLAVDVEHAFLEYLDMFYNLGLAGRAMKKMGAVEFVTTLAPGLRDVILTGKIKECVIRIDKNGTPVYDAVIVDAPPTGRIASFLDVASAMAAVAKTGPVASQADGVAQLVHSERTLVHLTTLLESLPVQETADAIAELVAAGFNVGSVIVNRADVGLLPESARGGDIDAAAVKAGLARAGLTVSDHDLDGMIGEAHDYAAVLRTQQECARELDILDVPRLRLPQLSGGIDLGALYELAAELTDQWVVR